MSDDHLEHPLFPGIPLKRLEPGEDWRLISTKKPFIFMDEWGSFLREVRDMPMSAEKRRKDPLRGMTEERKAQKERKQKLAERLRKNQVYANNQNRGVY